MPRIIFKILWDNLKSGNKVYAIVKNLRKDGCYYWAMGYYEPIFEGKVITGYVSYRRNVTEKQKDIIEPLYKELLEVEKMYGMDKSEEVLNNFLIEKQTNYNDFIGDLIECNSILKLFGFKPKFK